ncbi:unnamed protein product [Oikopleura dioica]|uniref:RRM domain-containing protein n=1 Tax=Oikopleura dioica TaxID=34765 RepID=E4YAN3_OIKDI|nr:unnamed protein product [Oikopleura dioica]
MADYYNGAEQAQPEAGNEYAGQAQSYAEQAAPQQAEQEEQKEEGKLIQNSEISNDSKMFVGGLSRSTTTESLRTYFESFGALRDASVKIDTMTQQSRGFGFILFEDAASVDAVMATPEHILDGKKIDPKKAERRDGKMFVGGILAETTDQTIKDYFGKYGEVEAVDRPVDKATGNYKGFCFVTFKRDGVMKTVCRDRYHEIDGKRCETKEGVPKNQMPRGGGQRGGYGGGYGAPGGYGGQGGYGAPGGYGGYQDFGGHGGGYGGYGGYGGGRGGGRGGGGRGGGASGAQAWGAPQGGQSYGGGYGGAYGSYDAPGSVRGGRGGGAARHQPY